MLWAGCFLAFVPGSARAVAILEAARQTRITAFYYEPNGDYHTETITDVDPVGFGYWSSSLSGGTPPYIASASQSSLIDLQELSGEGSVAMSITENFADTRYHVVFAVSAGTPYALAVDNVDAGYGGGSDNVGGSVRLSQVDPDDFGVVLQTIHSIPLGRMDFSGEGLPDFAADGLLAPGTYALDFRLTVPGSHNASAPADAGFLLLIPEPGTLVLVSAGLTLLALRRSRRKRSGTRSGRARSG
jgi:hypothetical protein